MDYRRQKNRDKKTYKFTKIRGYVIMKKILHILLLSTIFLILLIPLTCHADYQGRILVNGTWYTNHENAYTACENKKYPRIFIEGYKLEETAMLTEKVIAYFQKEYGLSLKKDISIYVAKDTKEYKKKLKFYEYNEIGAYKNTYALAFENSLINSIYINYEACGERFLFTLAHELTHVYQYLYYPEKVQNEDYMILEGKADMIASKITGYPIKVFDHGIPYENIKSKENRAKTMTKQGVETVKEQERFYANQTPGFFP